MKAIITGVTGQDGSYLAELLLSKGYTVIGTTRRSSTDTTWRLKGILSNPFFSLLELDITDISSIQNALRLHSDVNEFYNLAAMSHVATSFTHPGSTLDITGKGVINILQSLVDLDMREVRFFQASSSEMFGSAYDVKYEDNGGIKYQNEDTPFVPQSPYAIAKLAAHHATRLYREAYDLYACAGITFNHESPRRGENFVTRKVTKWVGEFYNWIRATGAIVDGFNEDQIIIKNGIAHTYPKLRLGNLDSYRDWGHAKDFVQAFHLMLQQYEPDDYVICTGETHTIRNLCEKAFNCIGVSNWQDFVYVDPKFIRPAEVDYLCGDCSKIKNRIGWSPSYTFDTLISEMVLNDIQKKL